MVGDVAEAKELVAFKQPFDLTITCVDTVDGLEQALDEGCYSVVVSAVRLEDEANSTDILDRLKRSSPFRPVIMIADPSDADLLLSAYEKGLDDKLIRCSSLESTCKLLGWTLRRCLQVYTPPERAYTPTLPGLIQQAVYDSLRETLIIFGGDARVLYYNKAAYDLGRDVFGVELRVGETLDQIYTDNVPASFRKRVDEYISRAMAGEYVCMREESAFADGTRIEREYCYEPLRDEDGRIIAVANVSRDLEEIRLVEHKLEASEARFWHFVEQLPIGVGVIDEQGHWTRVNPALQRFFGYTEGELKELTPIDVTHEDDTDDTRAQIEKLRSDEAPFVRFEKRYRHRDGRTLWADIMGMPLRLESNSGHFMGIITDITQRKQLEDQLYQSEKMRLIGQLAGGVAHDFNNLLTIITSYTHYVLNELGDGSPHAFALSKVLNAAQRGSSLTGQLLTFSRRHLSQPESIDLNEAVDELSVMVDRLLKPHVDISMNRADRSIPIWIDRGQLEQVFFNLVMNARDAMGASGTLRLTTSQICFDEPRATHFESIPPGSYGILEVCDSGHGIADDVLDHIFEPFFTTKDVGKGTGLGLASAWGIVAHAGGFIDVDSTPGDGTCFSLYFPISEQSAGVSDEFTYDELDVRERDATVLLVEDDDGVREALQQFLERRGFHTLVAANGAEALDYARDYAGPIDLLLTDVIMPGVNGRELAEAFARDRSNTRIVLMTGYAGAGLHELDEHWELLSKPIDLQELGRSLDAALE